MLLLALGVAVRGQNVLAREREGLVDSPCGGLGSLQEPSYQKKLVTWFRAPQWNGWAERASIANASLKSWLCHSPALCGKVSQESLDVLLSRVVMERLCHTPPCLSAVSGALEAQEADLSHEVHGSEKRLRQVYSVLGGQWKN